MQFHDHSSVAAGCSNKPYTVLTAKAIIDRLDKDINTICSALHLSKGEARILLTNFNWNVLQATDAWFHDEKLVRRNFGLLQESLLTSGGTSKGVNKFYCSICVSEYPYGIMISAYCGHLFCIDCYRSYIESKVVDGHGCVTLKCPEPDCSVVVLDDMIGMLVSDECKKRFEFYVVRSYIEEKENIKWCPAPGCDYAIEFELGSGNYDVECDCSYMFCWNCGEEIHRPVDCETVKAWLLKNKDVSASSLWIFAYTKPCPKCKKPIEKNKGCMHMTCPKPCSHGFCWVCLGDWKKHRGSFYQCNVYDGQKKNGAPVDSEASKRETGKILERYRHYYERWALNQSSRDRARENLKDWKSKNLWVVIDKYGKTELELQFITEAWLMIIECRRVLKWSYAYAFYMNEEESRKKEFFEYLQSEAEARLERLHHCAEKGFQDYLNAGENNHNIKLKVIELTVSTNRLFENLVRALENGLEDAKDWSGCRKWSEKDLVHGGSSSSTYNEYHQHGAMYNACSSSTYDDDDDDDDDDVDVVDHDNHFNAAAADDDDDNDNDDDEDIVDQDDADDFLGLSDEDVVDHDDEDDFLGIGDEDVVDQDDEDDFLGVGDEDADDDVIDHDDEEEEGDVVLGVGDDDVDDSVDDVDDDVVDHDDDDDNDANDASDDDHNAGDSDSDDFDDDNDTYDDEDDYSDD